MSPKISELSVRSLLHVTIIEPKIWSWLLKCLKICAPLYWTVHIAHNRTSKSEWLCGRRIGSYKYISVSWHWSLRCLPYWTVTFTLKAGP